MSYIPRRLWFVNEDGRHWLDQDGLLARSGPIVVLGEPGIGKSELLKHFGDQAGHVVVQASKLVNRPDPATLVGNAVRPVIDALDEVSAQQDGDAVDRVLHKLGLLNYPPFILSCRIGEWRSAIAARAIADQYDVPPLEVHLEPLDREEQRQLLSELTGDAPWAETLLAHFERFGLDFLGNPQTLGLIAELPHDPSSLPDTSTELFVQSVEQLRLERNDRKIDQELARDAAVDAAGAAFAGLILTGNARIADKTSGQIEPCDKELALVEVEGFDDGNVRRAASTTRFFASDADGLTYTHRRVGEFMGAQWLAKRANRRRKRKRLLDLFQSHGLVPASLRGLHAWLGRCDHMTEAVIDADPMGLIEYGDAESLSAEQARHLFAALERLARDNPAFTDWQEYRAVSLVTPALMPEVARIVVSRDAEFRLRMLLLQQLQGAATAEGLRGILRERMLDEHEIYAVRHMAGTVLTGLGGEDWDTLLDALLGQARHDAHRVAHELLAEIGVEQLSDRRLIEVVFARDGLSVCAVPPEREHNEVFGFYRLAEDVPVDRLDGLLDLFADFAAELLPEHGGIGENDLIDLAYALILRRLEAGGEVDPLRLWRWLKPLGEQSSYRRNRGKSVADWLASHLDVRRSIQKHVLLDTPSKHTIWGRAWPLRRGSTGLYPTQADVIALLQALDPADRSDERWRDVLDLGQTWGEEGRALREAAKPFAAHRPDLLAMIEGKAERPVPEWERREEERKRKQMAKQAVKFAEHRRYFLANLDKVRAGEFGYIVEPAQAYLKRFHDIGDGVPAHRRVAEWLGEDVAEAAKQGFRAFLRARPPVPSAGQIARSYAASRRWSAGDIIVAALAERVRTRRRPFRGVRTERLAAGLFECWHVAIHDHAGIKQLVPLLEAELKRRGKWEATLRLYIEPQLRRRKQYVDHLWAVMRDDDALGSDLAEEWLTRFPDMSGEAEVEMVDRLLRSNRREALRTLLADRRSRTLSEERRWNWDAVALLVDFDAARERLGPEVEPELMWHVRNRAGERRRDEGEGTKLSVAQLAWLIATFRGPWPDVDRPGTVTTGDVNPWDAAEYVRSLITRLGNDVSPEAVAALAALRDAPADGYTTALRIVSAQQRQKQADETYTPPTLAQIKAVLDEGPPGSVADLRAIVIDELRELGKRLRGSSDDEVRGYWRDDGKPRTENECRDRAVADLRGFLEPLSIFSISEADMPQDKRADIVFYHDRWWLPVEAKRQQHPDLWTAIDEQLQKLYSVHRQAEGQGAFLAFWFGAQYQIKAPPGGGPKPTSAQELQDALDEHPAVKSGRVAVVVLDVSRST